MELIRKQVRMNQMGKTVTDQFMIGGDYNVPDAKSDVGRVLSGEGSLRIEETRRVENYLRVTGKLNFKVLYVTDSGDPRPGALEGMIPFEEMVYMEEENGEGEDIVQVQRVECGVSLIHSRKLAVKALAEMTVHTEQITEKQVTLDVDGEEGKKPGLHLYRFIQADLSDILNKMLQTGCRLTPPQDWMDYCNMLKQRFTPFEAADKIVPDERVCSYYFWKIFQQYEEKDSILALGNNTANTAKLQIGVRYREQRVMTNYTCGSMGYDVPAAIGAAVASGKKVYCVTGDGSIMMNLQEMQTIVQNKLPVQFVVFSNEGYGAIRQTCKNFFKGEYIGCTPDTGVSFPDFEDVARTFGREYRICRTNAEVEASVRWLIQSDKPVLLEVCQRFDDPVTPKVMSRLDENGKMQSPALQDMYPFLDKEELIKIMWD